MQSFLCSASVSAVKVEARRPFSLFFGSLPTCNATCPSFGRAERPRAVILLGVFDSSLVALLSWEVNRYLQTTRKTRQRIESYVINDHRSCSVDKRLSAVSQIFLFFSQAAVIRAHVLRAPCFDGSVFVGVLRIQKWDRVLVLTASRECSTCYTQKVNSLPNF